MGKESLIDGALRGTRYYYPRIVLIVWFSTLLIGQLWGTMKGTSRIVKQLTTKQDTIAVVGRGDDWFDEEKWKLLPDNSRCFYVEDLCHYLTHWFYKPSNSKHQPQLSLDLLEPNGHSDFAFTKVSPRYIVTQRTIPENTATCTTSPVPNHMILHSIFSKMLGEFYVRVVSWLYVLSQQLRHIAGVDLDQFRVQTQMYIHKDVRYDLLDSHHLFLAPFTSNPLLDFQRLLQTPKCQCMKRVFFCGYGAKYRTGTDSTNLTLAGEILRGGKTDVPWHDIRKFMKKSVTDESTTPHLNYQMNETRKHYCVQKEQDRCQGGDIKIVGLAQRTLRRKWLDLDRLVKICNEKFQARKILCVEVNIEEAPFDHPIGHVLSHANLSALIGIHGAQLTDAIWMSEGSLVVELLPWIRSDGWGQWTRSVNGTTPLGVIFGETDLNHIGYPLKKADTPGCAHANATQPCRGGRRWNNNNFRLPKEVLFDLIERFVVSSPETCDEFEMAAGNEYLAYNVNCKQNTSTNEVVVKHFYRSKEWLKNVTGAA